MRSLLRVLPTRLARRLREALSRRILPGRAPVSVFIGRAHASGFIDSVEIGNDGTVSVLGWAPDVEAFARPLTVVSATRRAAPSHLFRVMRADLATLGGRHPERLGIVAEFVWPSDPRPQQISVMVDTAPIAEFTLPAFDTPPYGEFLGNPGVWHRHQVYGVGPPSPVVSAEVLDLCSDLDGPLLDFGCGAGALLTQLRRHGLDAHGLELDTPMMRAATSPGAQGHVTFYDGAMPSPFADGSFETVTCCEVLEHIPDYLAAIAEMARLARSRVLITVPDMSSIPRGFRHGVVPWHLLEASHVNFFTQQSLAAALAPHFSSLQFARIGEVRCDRLRFYTSLVALCDKRLVDADRRDAPRNDH